MVAPGGVPPQRPAPHRMWHGWPGTRVAKRTNPAPQLGFFVRFSSSGAVITSLEPIRYMLST